MRKRSVAKFGFILITFVALMLGAFGQSAQAGGGPTTVPWLRVYQIDPLAVGFAPFGVTPYGHAVAIAFDAGTGNLETIEVCGMDSGCSTFPPGYFFGGYDWSNDIQSGWTWMATTPTGSTLRARAIMVTPDGRREQISAEPIELQPSREASNEVWPFIDQAPTRLGETLKLRIERDLGLPVIRAEVCIAGKTWSCQYEDQKDWGLLLNGTGTQHFSLTLTHPNLSREGANGKLLGFPNGASVMVRYTMVDGSSVSFLSQPLFFLP